jgi:hypothetical protein
MATKRHSAAKQQSNKAPLLGKGGVAAPSRKWSPSFEGAAGVVRSTTDNRWLEPTTPSAPAKEAARHFVDGRSHPSLAKEGSLARRKIPSEKQKAPFVISVPFCGYSLFCFSCN